MQIHSLHFVIYFDVTYSLPISDPNPCARQVGVLTKQRTRGQCASTISDLLSRGEAGGHWECWKKQQRLPLQGVRLQSEESSSGSMKEQRSARVVARRSRAEERSVLSVCLSVCDALTIDSLSNSPTLQLSNHPTIQPYNHPDHQPSNHPTIQPSNHPSLHLPSSQLYNRIRLTPLTI